MTCAHDADYECADCIVDRMRVRPVQNERGTWDALSRDGYGHSLGYATKAECEAWIDGYDTGASENM